MENNQESNHKWPLMRLLSQETDRPLYKIVVMAGLSGTANAVLLAVINTAAKITDFSDVNIRPMLMFGITLALFVISQKYILHESAAASEEMIAKIRVRLSNKIRKANLLNLERIGQSQIYNRLAQETMVISNASTVLISSLQSAIMLFFVSFYIIFLSKTAFFLILTLLVAAVLFFLHNYKKLQKDLRAANETEVAFFESLTDLLDGSKEIRVNRKKSNALLAFFKHIAVKLRDLKATTTIKYTNNSIFAQSFFYFLLGAIVFILPRFFTTYSEVLTQLTASVLFIIAPIGSIVGAIQTFDRVNFSISNIYRLETELEKITEIQDGHPDYNNQFRSVEHFETIKIKDAGFAYQDEKGQPGFAIGPFNLDFNSGETVFIVGGNGSGKTTFLKMLCMLYHPEQGSIWLDDALVAANNAVDYRELFSIVFSDFHIFSKLYGLEDVKREKVDELLKTMELDHKTQFLGDHFSTLDLSTGQRKRLALLISLLEDKPIYIFDEWAADQDPEFRQYFYEVLLKKLKEKGKTIIAASHDDRYFDYADRVIKLDYGKISEDYRTADCQVPKNAKRGKK